jgi:hypothetical protein
MGSKEPTVAQLLYAAKAIFEARVIVESYLQKPQGKLDTRLQELEMGYYRHAEAKALERKAKAVKR